MALGKLSDLEVSSSMLPKQNTSSKKKKEKQWKLENVKFLYESAFNSEFSGRRKTKEQRKYLWTLS